jgi:isoquinoline 1-oxidoreductase beta subunit
MEKISLSRRDFLIAGAAAGGGLVIGFSLTGCDQGNESSTSSQVPENVLPSAGNARFTPNAWLTIASDGSVTIRVGSSEMGQGTLTGIAMLIADELDADWSRVYAEHAPANSAFTNPLLGRQHTGGSTAIRGFWDIVRKAGASGREMLIQAAAQHWGVAAAECHTSKGEVIHDGTGHTLAYGELAAAAAKLPVPELVFLKEPEDFQLIGQPIARLDTPDKVNGRAIFGMDVQLPDMLTATVVRCPVKGGTLKSFDAGKAEKIPGVKGVAAISAGVAVIAEHYWAAKKGRDALRVEWNFGDHEALDSVAIEARFKAALDQGLVERDDGNIDSALAAAAKTLDAVYTVPYQAHACMEPMNATADVRADGCDLYLGTQGQTASQDTAMNITGLSREQVKVNTMFLGGGFGRRSEQDFVADAVECSRLMGRPVKVIWSREDDIMHDQYRPATYNRLRGGVATDGKLLAWEHRIAGPSILARVAPQRAADGHDWSSTEGAKNLPYDIASLRVSYAMVNTPVPVGFWRSVGSSQNAFITECFFDELARLAGRDPLQARLELLDAHPRHAGVLQLAAQQAGWGEPLAQGHARGIAVAEAFGSYTAQVAEVSIDRGVVRVHRITCAVDCGMVVNPDSVRAQMEGGIVYGLTATLKGAITVAGGRIQQSNFDDFPLLRLDECPQIDVHIVDSQQPPGGVGEPGVPPTAPAVANAVFALTGKPVRSLPIRLAG